MPKPRSRDVKAALEAQTRRRSIRELAAKGMSHVRVLSTKNVVRLIQAIVDESLVNRNVSLGRDERERLVAQAQKRFDAFTRKQAESDERLTRQRETIASYESTIEALQRTEADLRRQLEEARAREERLGDIRVMLQELTENGASGRAPDFDASELKQQFATSLDEAVSQIDLAVRRGTAEPIEAGAVDATTPMLDKLFEDAPELESNTEQLDLADSEAEGIAGSLARLKALRAGAGASNDEPKDDPGPTSGKKGKKSKKKSRTNQ